MSTWTQVGENLVRHEGGKIYLRAKVNGKVIRVSLGVSDLRIAKIKRDDHLAGMRSAAAANPSGQTVRTLGDAVAVVAGRILEQPQLQERTREFYRDIIRVLKETLPVEIHGRTWTAGEAASWWRKIAGRFATQRANHVLMVGKQVGKALVELGLRVDDPTAKLKRMKIVGKNLDIPALATLKLLIADIRSQNKAHSEQAANYVAFLAFAGCRHGQARAFEWKHVEQDWIVFPAGIEGTKGAATRRLPISPPLREVLEAMRPEGEASGPLFTMRGPRNALENACERLKLPHMRIHDLRHFFASFALQAGVDVPTVSKWLGHKDGGALVLKTYAHLHDEHSLASAAKLGAQAPPVNG